MNFIIVLFIWINFGSVVLEGGLLPMTEDIKHTSGILVVYLTENKFYDAQVCLLFLRANPTRDGLQCDLGEALH